MDGNSVSTNFGQHDYNYVAINSSFIYLSKFCAISTSITCNSLDIAMAMAS